MSNPVWPNNLTPAGLEWRLQKSGVLFRSPFTGSLQANDFMGEFWDIKVSLRGEGKTRQNSAQLEALLMYLAGGHNQVDIWHWVRPLPKGTLRGTPVLRVVTVRGDLVLRLTTQANVDLFPGDFLGVGTQVFMVRTYCKATGTSMDVPILNRVRGVIAEGSPVVWNRPTVPVVSIETSAGLVYRPGTTLPSEINLSEP